jgi:DNA-binding beta-propeller fold protein YncE/DNA-binding winged helix-turn-helix (wHTH) protein
MPVQTTFDFRILGELEVHVDGRPLDTLTAGQRMVLGTLLLHANEVVPRAPLARRIWPNDATGTATRRLGTQVTGLRRKLTGADGERRLIENRPDGYVISVEPDELDALRFVSLSREGREALDRGEPQTAAEVLGQALALWRGPVLGDEPNGPAEQAARQLESLRTTAIAARVEAERAAARAPEPAAVDRDEQADPHGSQQNGGRQPEQAAPEETVAVAAVADEHAEPAGTSLPSADEASAPTPPEPVTEAPAATAVAAAVATAPEPLPQTEERTQGQPRQGGKTLAGIAAVLLTVAAVGAAGFAYLRDDAESGAAAAAPRPVRVTVEPNTVVGLDPSSGELLASYAVGADPDRVALADGDVWVVNADEGTVARVDPAVGDVDTIDSVPAVQELAASDTDGVWVAGYQAPGVKRLATDGFRGSATVPMRPEVAALALGGGYLWVVKPPGQEGQPETVSLIDAETAEVADSAPIGMDSQFVAFGHGLAWISSQRDDTVTTVSTSGEAETYDVGPGPSGIAFTGDAVWIAHFWNDEVWRLDPLTKEVEARIPVGQGPYDVQAGLGAVWVSSVDSRTITRIDPATNEVTATFMLSFPARALAIGEDTLWATIRACGSPVYAC